MKKAQSTSSGSSNKGTDQTPSTGSSQNVYDWLHNENYKNAKPYTVSLNDARNKKKSEKVVKPSHQVSTEQAKEEDFDFWEQYRPVKPAENRPFFDVDESAIDFNPSERSFSSEAQHLA